MDAWNKTMNSCVSRIKILGDDLASWRRELVPLSRRGVAGRMLRYSTSEVALWKWHFGALIMAPSLCLRWKLLSVHLSCLPQGNLLAGVIELLVNIKWRAWLGGWSSHPTHIIMFLNCCWVIQSCVNSLLGGGCLFDLFYFCEAELWWNTHNLWSFQKVDFFPLGATVRLKSAPWQDSLWKGVTHTFHISIKERG